MAWRILLISSIAMTSIFIYGYWQDSSSTDGQQLTAEALQNYTASNMLDGMTFVGELGPEGKPTDVTDVFVFGEGTFVSKECELRCDFPARPYYISKSDEGIKFISKTKCPYKDAEITWRGAIQDGKITGTDTWTIRRWYWTATSKFEFAGSQEKSPDKLASTK